MPPTTCQVAREMFRRSSAAVATRREGHRPHSAETRCYGRSGVVTLSPIQTMARTFGRLIDLTSAPRRIVRATVCAALIASASEAAAQQPTQHTINADAIFRGCKILAEGGTADVVLQSAGAGFLFGLASLPQDLSPPEWRSCPPSGSNPSQFAQALVKYIEAHQERIREDFRGLTLAAFHDTWPCSN
jgi:Rap1a immunity proteins